MHASTRGREKGRERAKERAKEIQKVKYSDIQSPTNEVI